MDVCTCLFSIKVHRVWFHCVTFVLDFVHFNCFPTLLVMFSAERKTSRGGWFNKFKVKSHPSLKDHQALVTNNEFISLEFESSLNSNTLINVVWPQGSAWWLCQFPSANFPPTTSSCVRRLNLWQTANFHVHHHVSLPWSPELKLKDERIKPSLWVPKCIIRSKSDIS